MINNVNFSEELSSNQGLQAWAVYLGQLQTEVKTVRRTTVDPPPRPQSLEVPKTAGIQPTAVFHTATCRCSVCSSSDLSTTGNGISGARIIKVKLTGELSEEEQKLLERLRARDAEVRRHEQAHVVAAGHHALGNPSYTYQVGPDGRRYAIGGEVQIDLSPVPGDPEATLRKAQQLRQAALAPSNPSAADRQVAAAASGMAHQALQELGKVNLEKLNRSPEEAIEPVRAERESRRLLPHSSPNEHHDILQNGIDVTYGHTDPEGTVSPSSAIRASKLDIYV